MLDAPLKKRVVTYRDFNVYRQSFDLAMEIFHETKHFPRAEQYSLIDQIRRAARSVPANIAEGWAKRKYENVFKRHIYDAMGSCEEVRVWLEFALECQYMDDTIFVRLNKKCSEVGAMLSSLANKWQTFK